MEKDTHMQVNSNNKIAGGGGGVQLNSQLKGGIGGLNNNQVNNSYKLP